MYQYIINSYNNILRAFHLPLFNAPNFIKKQKFFILFNVNYKPENCNGWRNI